MPLDSTIVSLVDPILSIILFSANIEITVCSSENHSQRPVNMNKNMGDY